MCYWGTTQQAQCPQTVGRTHAVASELVKAGTLRQAPGHQARSGRRRAKRVRTTAPQVWIKGHTSPSPCQSDSLILRFTLDVNLLGVFAPYPYRQNTSRRADGLEDQEPELKAFLHGTYLSPCGASLP